MLINLLQIHPPSSRHQAFNIRIKPPITGIQTSILQASDHLHLIVKSSIPGIKLTHFTHGLGCACKIRPQYLEKILKDLPVSDDPNVLVGLKDPDDAAVYRIDDRTAIVQTVDFFTPVVDDPYDFGAIAAANALSDIYAMGGKALVCT